MDVHGCDYPLVGTAGVLCEAGFVIPILGLECSVDVAAAPDGEAKEEVACDANLLPYVGVCSAALNPLLSYVEKCVPWHIV